MVVSLSVAIVIHIILFFLLGHLKFEYNLNPINEPVLARVAVRPVEDDFTPELLPAPEEVETPQPEPEQISMIDDVEVLEKLPDPELEMKPDISQPSFDVTVKFENPALAGDPLGDIAKITNAIDINQSELDSLGKTETITPTAADGQLIVDPGKELAEAQNLDTAMEDLIKKGAAGLSSNGLPDGTSTLDEIAGLPANVLVTKTTMLPGDLLFEFNSDQLRPSAKLGMQKIALVMDLNPDLYCWIDGHTDLIGNDVSNDELSRRRAESVKNYLVGIGMDAEKIITRGYGKRQPIILRGDQNEQAANRRVELKMRKSRPNPEDMGSAPARANIVEEEVKKAQPVPPEVPDLPETPQENPPKAILVKPMRATPVPEETQETDPVDPQIPRAAIVEEGTDPAIESGEVREVDPPRAQAVEE